MTNDERFRLTNDLALIMGCKWSWLLRDTGYRPASVEYTVFVDCLKGESYYHRSFKGRAFTQESADFCAMLEAANLMRDIRDQLRKEEERRVKDAYKATRRFWR